MNVFFGCLVIFFVARSCNDSSLTDTKDKYKSPQTSDSIPLQNEEVKTEGDSLVPNQLPDLGIVF